MFQFAAAISFALVCLDFATPFVVDSVAEQSYNHFSTVEQTYHFCKKDDVNATKVNFHLFTREGFYMNLTVENTHQYLWKTYNHVDKVSKVIVHGWNQSSPYSEIERMTRYYLLKQYSNVVLVDWSAFSLTCTIESAKEHVAPVVASYLAVFLDNLLSRGNNVTRTHLLGHDVGAHICGLAAKLMKPKRIGRITGLDYQVNQYYGIPSLETGDARFVDVIVTSHGLKETYYRKPVGHAMYHVPVLSQPGCENEPEPQCSSLKSLEYYANTIAYPRLYKCTPPVNRRSAGDDHSMTKKSISEEDSNIYMGEEADPKNQGYFICNMRPKTHTPSF